ncbi:MAG: DUF58 domain-containing protein [Bdellovibrionales bacterium]|nr:DUF58 domain-containing protein [Bdellovibrionales bacterium]
MKNKIKNLNRCFIKPTGHGIVFLILIFLILAVALRVENNLVFILGFVLFAVLTVTIPMTYYNIKNLNLNFIEVSEVFSGDTLTIKLDLFNNSKQNKTSIQVAEKVDKEGSSFFIHEIPSQTHWTVALNLQPLLRGKHAIPHIIISTIYPLGLFKSWIIMEIRGDFFVYPKKINIRKLNPQPGQWVSGNGDSFSENSFADDFKEHKPFTEGQSQYRVDWKAFARRGVLLSKHYESNDQQHYLLDWNKVKELPFEEAVSQLATWIEYLRNSEHNFAVILDGFHSGWDQGFYHGKKCLQYLSTFQRKSV